MRGPAVIDYSDVTQFAVRLATPIQEDRWQDEWSDKLAEEMRRNAPIRTGALRNSIRTTGEGVVVGVAYGAYVEYGTSDTAPQPYAVPAMNYIAKPAASDLGDEVIRHLT
jgi:HK97 gp10 family phage protein